MPEKHSNDQFSKSSRAATNTFSMAQFAEKAYLDYSMYVILDRALPNISDGLKPVQRRIVYAMSDLGLHATAKYKKSARTVGDVLGKFHPHGDTACYEAMVLMAQPFSYRYPLIDGQGNWGSQDDPKSFAAMRYTESRLTLYAQLLLEEVDQGTCEWVANFDGTLEEPKLLPSRIPNFLLNGASGIAVGMATDIPPHNMREVITACVRILEDPTTTLEQICEHIQAPDFPTKAEIISSSQDIFEIYKTGNGSIRQRATWERDDNDIVINALPYQVSGSKVQEQIAAQMTAKKLPMIGDLRDESDHENPTRLVIELKSNRTDVESLMQHLFAITDLERVYRVNLNLIGLNGKPGVFDLRTLLVEWLEFRIETTKKKLQFRHQKVLERLHILDGLLVAFLHIDEVIHTIRNENQPIQVLMKKYNLSETQANSILNMRLRHLAKLEEIRITTEQNELRKERKTLESILESRKKLKITIRDELISDAQTYGDNRRSPIVERPAAQTLDQNELIPAEQVTVILSDKGWIRAAKGHEIDGKNLNYKAEDQFLCQARGKTNDLLLTIDSTGRTYSLFANLLPSARSFGEPVSSSLKPQSGITFQGLMMGNNNTEYLLSTSAGYGFIAKLGDMHTRNKAGKTLLKVTSDTTVLIPQPISNIEKNWLAILTNVGRLLICATQEISQLTKGKGIKLINIPSVKFKTKEEFVVGIAVLQSDKTLRIHSGKRYLNIKAADFQSYLGKRAQRGKFLPRGFTQAQHISVKDK